MTPDYRFARRPTWLIAHLIALVAVVSFVNLGSWQLRRNDDRTKLDTQITARLDEAPLEMEAATAMPVALLELRRLRVAGVFDPAVEIVLQARTLRGRSGHNVLTPLVMADGSAVIVNRGWIPIDFEGPPVVGAEPPQGPVTIVGIARQTEIRSGLGPTDPPTGDLDRISRVDLDRLRAQLPYELADFYVQLIEPQPVETFPLILDLPVVGAGPPHFAYAMQWFAFAGVVLIGYPLLMRATARKRHSGGGGD